jgi:hypothetical protein
LKIVDSDEKIENAAMTLWMKFLIRAFLGIGLAVILSRLFFYRISTLGVLGLAVFLVGMGYMAETIRKRR